MLGDDPKTVCRNHAEPTGLYNDGPVDHRIAEILISAAGAQHLDDRSHSRQACRQNEDPKYAGRSTEPDRWP